LKMRWALPIGLHNKNTCGHGDGPRTPYHPTSEPRSAGRGPCRARLTRLGHSRARRALMMDAHHSGVSVPIGDLYELGAAAGYELVSVARGFGDSVARHAGECDADGILERHAVAHADVHGLHTGARAQHQADLLAVVDERGGAADPGGG